MSRIVQKFGGTSLADVDRIKNVARRVRREVDAGNEVAVVVSAMAGVTNQLVDWTRQSSLVHDAREYDVVVSSGEQVTAGLLALALQDLGVDARFAVDAIGTERNLPAQPRARIDPKVLKREREQARGYLLARGNNDVVFARVMHETRLARPVDELVRHPRHS